MAQNKRGNQPKVKKASAARKSGKPAKPAPTDLRPQILRAAMDLAGHDGWESTTPAAIAAEAGVRTADVTALYADIWEIAAAVLEEIEQKTAAEVEDYLTDHWRDNLLEILMTRFDFAQDSRAALTTLPAFAARHPRHGRRLLRRLYGAMRRMLHLARLEEERITPLSVAAFGLVYLSLVDRWRKDDTPDLSPTMAAADKRLGWFERALGYLDRAACPPARKAAAKARSKARQLKRKIKGATG